MLGYKSTDTPIDLSTKSAIDCIWVIGVSKHRTLVGKINYLTVKCPEISFDVTVVSQFPYTCIMCCDAVVHL